MLEHLPEAIGHALSQQRAGLENIAFNTTPLRAGMAAITVRSPAFADHAPIPPRYTADGEGLSPPLEWSGVPANADSLVLVVEDADAPTPRPLVHAIVVDLPARQTTLPEGALKSPDHDGQPVQGVEVHEGRNSYLMAGWLPPDPPPGHGTHRYAFQLFALAAGDAFSGTPGRELVLEALRARALASGCLIGTYDRPDASIPLADAQPASLFERLTPGSDLLLNQ